MKNRLLSLLLTLVMIVGMLPGFALNVDAEDADAEAAWGESEDAVNLTTGTLAEAIAAVNNPTDNNTVHYIKLLTNVDIPYSVPAGWQNDKPLPAAFTVENGPLTFDFNGQTITMNSTDPNVYAPVLTVDLSVNAQETEIIFKDDSDTPGGISNKNGVAIVAETPITIQGGKYSGSDISVLFHAESTCTITGGIFSAGHFAVATNSYCPLSISGGTFLHGSESAIRHSNRAFTLKLSGRPVFIDETPGGTESVSVDIIIDRTGTEFSLDGYSGGELDLRYIDDEDKKIAPESLPGMPNGWNLCRTDDTVVTNPADLVIGDVYTLKPTEVKWGTDAENLTHAGALANALTAAAAENAGNIYIQLQKDIALPDGTKLCAAVSSGTTLTLDFNGCTVSGKLEGRSSTLFDFLASSDTGNAGEKLTLLDSSDKPGGIRVSEGSPFVSTIPLVVEGGVYEGSGCSFAERSASAEIKGGIFRSTKSAALNVYNVGTLTISGGTFRTDEEYAFYCYGEGEVNINGGTFFHGTECAIYSSSGIKLSGKVDFVDETPDDSSVDLILKNRSAALDLSEWEGGTLDVMVPEITGQPDKVTVEDILTLPNEKWGVFDSEGSAVETMEINKIYTVKPDGHTVIFYDNSESHWQYVQAAFTLGDKVGYEQGTQIGESSLHFLEVPDGVTEIYFTNYMPQMPEEYYPEGIRRTITFTLEPNKSYEYIPGNDEEEPDEEEPGGGETDDEDSLYLQLVTDMMQLRFPSNAIVSGGGKVAADRSVVRYNQDITYTITPDEGYAIADVIVNGKSVGAVSEYTFSNVRKQHKIEVVFEKIGWQNPFTDIFDADWFYEDVRFVSENGLMNGVSDGHFSPDGLLTRDMLVTVLWRLEGEPVVDYIMPFTDIPANEWYTEAVRWAAAEGIVNGYEDGTFGSDGEITREQTMAILHRYAAYKGLDNGAVFPMIPQCDCSPWAENDIIWADMIGLTGNIGKDIFDMTKSADRGEIAAYLRRFCEAFEIFMEE